MTKLEVICDNMSPLPFLAYWQIRVHDATELSEDENCWWLVVTLRPPILLVRLRLRCIVFVAVKMKQENKPKETTYEIK